MFSRILCKQFHSVQAPRTVVSDLDSTVCLSPIRKSETLMGSIVYSVFLKVILNMVLFLLAFLLFCYFWIF